MIKNHGKTTIARRPSPQQNDGDELVEKQIQRDNNEQIGLLAQNISSIKKLSKSITTTLKDEESLMDDLENGFGKSDTLMSSSMNKLGKLMNSSGGNVL
mmetsp:Transcript_21943/g.24377  ORF Transcript_21943/g.24377 Transcript_21943/m.24377 type:complete len:99 (+) Transcript_21943:36-332(+)